MFTCEQQSQLYAEDILGLVPGLKKLTRGNTTFLSSVNKTNASFVQKKFASKSKGVRLVAPTVKKITKIQTTVIVQM